MILEDLRNGKNGLDSESEIAEKGQVCRGTRERREEDVDGKQARGEVGEELEVSRCRGQQNHSEGI